MIRSNFYVMFFQDLYWVRIYAVISHNIDVNWAFLYLGLAAALYSSIATLAKPQLMTIHPILLSSSIYLIIGIVLTIFINLTCRSHKVSKSEFKLIFLTSICGSVAGPIIYFYGLILTSASLASILINIEFVFSILLAVIILR